MKRILLFLCFLISFFTATAQIKSDDENIYTFVEQMPEFPGGPENMLLYIAQNIRYPSIALLNGQEGTVFVSFVVNKKGEVTQPEILKSAAPSLDAEAIRVCETMPKWQPGKQNGQEVAVKYTLPVRFKIGKQESALISSAEADTVPRFPGGHDAMVAYLAENLQYPSEAAANNIEGSELVSFTVLETGERTDYRIEESTHLSLSQEAIRLLFSMPPWEPAKKAGKPISVRHAVSIPFKIESDKIHPDLPGDSITIAKKENQPEFPGGSEAILRYLGQNIKYPSDAAKNGIQGKVILTFVVDHRGQIRNIETVRSVFPSV